MRYEVWDFISYMVMVQYGCVYRAAHVRMAAARQQPQNKAIISAGLQRFWAYLGWLGFSMQNQLQTNWCWAAGLRDVIANFLTETCNGHNVARKC